MGGSPRIYAGERSALALREEFGLRSCALALGVKDAGDEAHFQIGSFFCWTKVQSPC